MGGSPGWCSGEFCAKLAPATPMNEVAEAFISYAVTSLATIMADQNRMQHDHQKANVENHSSDAVTAVVTGVVFEGEPLPIHGRISDHLDDGQAFNLQVSIKQSTYVMPSINCCVLL